MKYFRLDSSPPDENDIEIPQKPITDTNDTVMVSRHLRLIELNISSVKLTKFSKQMEQTDCENQNEQLNVNDDVIAHQPEDILNRIEISPQSTSLPEKENIEVIVVEEQICGNKNPLKRKFDEKVVAGSSSKVCKVEPLKNFQANNLLISNSIADVKQKKVAADESLKKIPKLEAEVVNMDAMKVTYANDRNTLIERHRLAIEALKESNHNEINELNEAHRKALDEVITEKNSFVDTQSQTIDLMKQSMMAKFDKDLEKNGQKFKDEIENLKAEHRKEINDKEESHRKSLVELNKSNSEVLRKVMAEKFHVIESQNQNFELVKNRFAEEKQRLINERDNIKKTHDEKFNLLKSEMEDAIAAMNQSHNTEIQMLKDSSQNQLNETNQLKDNVINNLATKLDKERRFYCDQICRLKDDIENQKDSRQKEIVDLEALNALTAAKTDHKNNIDPANLETIEKQLIEKSKFHSENVQSIIKKCDVKRMKDISVLKSELKNQSEAHAIELNRLADEIELLKKNGGEIERMKSQHDAERTEWNRKFEKNSKENDKLHEYVVNQLKKNHEVIVQELYQKSNQKLLQCEETMKKLNEQKTAFETELKTSKENHIQTITKLQSEMKKTNEMNNKRTEELQMAQYRILEFEKKTTELQNERMQFVNELNRLRMNCGQPGEEQAMLAKNDRHTRIEQSHKYLTEQHSILYNENIKLKSSHQRLDQVSQMFDLFRTILINKHFISFFYFYFSYWLIKPKHSKSFKHFTRKQLISCKLNAMEQCRTPMPRQWKFKS